MTVGTFGTNDFTTQTATNYKSTIDSNSMVMKRVVDCFAPRQTTTPAMTLSLDAGFTFKGTTLTEVAAQTSGTITAPVGNPRIDRAVVDRSTGVLSIITGTPNASPTAPAITSGKIPIAQILLQTSSTTITNSMITDERALWALGRGLAGEEGIGQWLKDDGAGNLTLNINPTLQDNGSGALSTSLTTEATVASATTTDLGSVASNIINVTGTATITSFGSSANAADPLYIVRFASTATVTHNASSLILQAGVNFVATAGSFMVLKYEGSGNWREIFHQKKSVVTAGVYSAPTITVDSLGNITSIATGSSGITQVKQLAPITSSGTYTPTAGMKYCRVRLKGPGGGSGGVGNNWIASGGAGEGGYCEKIFSAADIGVSQSVTIGSPGAAGSSGGVSGTDGGTSLFGAFLTANGGKLSAGRTTNGVAPGGDGGTATGGDINIKGSCGESVVVTGGSSQACGGKGGATILCTSGLPGINGSTGAASNGYGAGGPGSATASGGGFAGVTGTGGVCLIEEFI